jgi:small-conductance mechanosensitive channel
METNSKSGIDSWRGIIFLLIGTLLGIALILVTLDISHRNIINFVVTQQKYIISAEAALLGVLLTEMLARIASHHLHERANIIFSTRFRIMVRIIGYVIVVISVISILASNPTLGISAGAIGGVVIAFAMQNIVGNMLAAVTILNTRMVHIGEEITVSGVKGVVTNINLSHTIIHVDEDVVFIPNSVMVSQTVRRKKRTNAGEWME